MEKEYETKYNILINYLKELMNEKYISEKDIKFILKVFGEIKEVTNE